MTLDADCIFCKIIRGNIPSVKVLEDDTTLAFMDINPANEGHALAIPKFHAKGFLDVPGDWLTATMLTAQKVARAIDRALEPDGINIVVAHGAGAAQSVLHLHVHVLPRAKGDELKLNWGLRPGDPNAIKKIAEKIRKKIR